MKKLLCTLLVLTAGTLWAAATYYVDFDNGNDTQDGTTTTLAWKHAPGDPAARNNPATVVLAGGDVVQFKGGVVYRGAIGVKQSGTMGNPLTYKGDGWGAGQAILDGADPIATAWTRCASANDCRGNPHWQNIWYTTLPESVRTIFTPVYENGEFLWVAQDPNPGDFFNFDKIEDFRTLPLNNPLIRATRTSLVDTGHFIQTDSTFWVGAYVGIWHNPNVVTYREIKRYVPATHMVYFDSLTNDPYTDRDAYYCVLNHLGIIDTTGEFYYDFTTQRLYAWPYAADPNSAEFALARRTIGFNAENRSYCTVTGFVIRNYYGGIDWWNQGVGVNSGPHTIVRNCEVTHLRSLAGAAAVGVGTNCLAESNYVHHNQRNIGILGGGTNVIIRNNVVEMCSRQGIWFMGTTHGLITGNVVRNILGTHSNAISVYLNSSEILVAGNRVYHSNNCGTIERSQNITIYNNFFDSGISGFHDWSGTVNTRILNNTFMQGTGLGSTDSVYIFKNNITNGGGAGDHTNTIYTGLGWSQTATYGWYPDTTDITGPEDGGQHTGVDQTTFFNHAPRFEATITSFYGTTALHVDDFYNFIVAAGNRLVIDNDTLHARTVSNVAVVYADGGNRRTRITFTPAVAETSGARVAIWPAAGGFYRDYTLLSTGRAVDAGCDVTSLLPIAAFPEYDFTKDLAGNPRVAGAGWDIGPYEYAPTGLRTAECGMKSGPGWKYFQIRAAGYSALPSRKIPVLSSTVLMAGSLRI
jgi:hypothetical protein